jgi:hypothetical protein
VKNLHSLSPAARLLRARRVLQGLVEQPDDLRLEKRSNVNCSWRPITRFTEIVTKPIVGEQSDDRAGEAAQSSGSASSPVTPSTITSVAAS